MVDYRELLKKYMKLVRSNEWTDFTAGLVPDEEFDGYDVGVLQSISNQLKLEESRKEKLV